MGAIYLYLDSAYHHPILGLVLSCLLMALLMSSLLLLFYDRWLAVSGFLAFLFGTLMEFSMPVF